MEETGRENHTRERGERENVATMKGWVGKENAEIIDSKKDKFTNRMFNKRCLRNGFKTKTCPSRSSQMEDAGLQLCTKAKR